MQQKEVKLIGLRAENHGIIKAAVLTPDILSKRLITLSGEMGNGKSTIMDMMKTAVSGTDAIRKKDILEEGYIAEAQLTDGDINLFIGVKVTSYVRGEKAGEPKFETILYAKDVNGKHYTPLIDGAQPTAADYAKMLTTELTFSMPDLFSQNQTIHRNFIEKLYKDELNKLGADAVIAEIIKIKTQRDTARAMCQNMGAFMESFEREGYTETMLENLEPTSVEEIEANLLKKQIERDRLVNSSDDAFTLAKERLDNERTTKLQALKDKGHKIKNEIDDAYQIASNKYNEVLDINQKINDQITYFEGCFEEIKKMILVSYGENEYSALIISKLQELTSIKQNGLSIQLLTEIPPVKNKTKEEELSKVGEDYHKLKDTPIAYPEKGVVDTSVIDAEIEELEQRKQGAKAINDVYKRYQQNRQWIELNGMYLAEVDKLRKMYASINCGVKGMNIVPRETNTGKIEVWIQYNGEYDIDFFKNPNKEQRMMFEYSSFQRTIIGLMLQAARLDIKKKALRLAFVDDVAFTENGINILRDVAERLNLQLVVAWTHEVEKENLRDGEVAVIGGEIFFNN